MLIRNLWKVRIAVLEIVKKFPSEEKFRLSDQLKCSYISKDEHDKLEKLEKLITDNIRLINGYINYLQSKRSLANNINTNKK